MRTTSGRTALAGTRVKVRVALAAAVAGASQTRYSAVSSTGRFNFSRDKQVLRFTSGFLRGAEAHYVTSPQKALDLKRNENLRHGRPRLDLSATYCYFGKK
jgi:hypothetical protein